MKTTLAELLNRKRADVEHRKRQRVPRVPTDDRRVRWDRDRFRVIAEIKRASLSAGNIRPNLNPVSLARSYETAGAAAISVLTEEHYFHGSLDDLRTIRGAISIPILQKDFILDEYQILEAKEAGADFILLIARFLEPDQIRHLLRICEQNGLNALVEVTDEQDVQKIRGPVRYLGVNSRDLETLQVDTSRFERMRKFLPDAYLIAESGINSIELLQQITDLGYHGALIGEHLLRANDPAAELSNFVGAGLRPARALAGRPARALVKICGITNERDAQIAIDAGASALGFIFAESPRAITVDKLQKFRARIPIACVGVFRGNSAEQIESIIRDCSLDVAQIYDDDLSISTPTWHARTVDSLQKIEELPHENTLIDIKLPERDLPKAWNFLSRRVVFALAGGLHSGNVSEAIASCKPKWVDVARGVENEPGIKDPHKIREFMKAVQQ